VAAADPSALLGWHACLYRGQDLQAEHYHLCMTPFLHEMKRKEKKRKDYAFRRQFNEKPSIIPGCPDPFCMHIPGHIALKSAGFSIKAYQLHTMVNLVH